MMMNTLIRSLTLFCAFVLTAFCVLMVALGWLAEKSQANWLTQLSGQ